MEVPRIDEVVTASVAFDDSYVRVDDVDFRLFFEAPGPDVDLEAELGQFLREFEHINDLTACIRRAERRIGCNITVG